jgi:hypothetical protein
MTSNIYIDCNRQNSILKTDVNNNEWEYQLVNTLRIPTGSQVKINNSMINYKGLQGGSIEISEDTQISLCFSYYISHSDFLIPQSDFRDSDATNSPTKPSNPWCEYTGLQTTCWDCFQEVGYQYLLTNELRETLSKDASGNILPDGGIYSYISNGVTYGRTEQPLHAIVVNQAGFIEPLCENLIIPIPKGTYGITQFTNIVQDFINGTRISTGADGFKTDFQNNYEIGQWGINTNIQSRFCKNVKAFDHSYIYGDVNYSNFYDITQQTSGGFMYNETSKLGKVLYITTEDFNVLMNSYAFNSVNLPAGYLWENWRQGHYYAGIYTPYYTNTGRDIVVSNPLQYLYTAESESMTQDSVEKATGYYDYNPLLNGYYLGTSDFQFNYDTELNSFSFSFLHSPRRIDEYDRVGNKNDQSGKIVSYLKKDVTLLDRMNLGQYFIPDPFFQQPKILNTMYNPRQRNGGIIIYNFDYKVAQTNQNRMSPGSGLSPFTANNIYKRFIDFFTDGLTAAKAWENSILYQLGFTYASLNDTVNFELVSSFDLGKPALYGMTTNNILDITTQSSLSDLYCPQESVITYDNEGKIVDHDYINWDNSITSQVKNYDLQTVSKNRYGISTYNSQNWKYVYCSETSCFPILTSSQTVNAPRLPTLSKNGYFIITSDIFNHQDECGVNSVMPILGIVNKSNLSNQDFISSYNDIVHTTTKDIILNKIKIRILNSDLSIPQLDPNSSILIQILLAPQKVKDGFII